MPPGCILRNGSRGKYVYFTPIKKMKKKMKEPLMNVYSVFMLIS